MKSYFLQVALWHFHRNANNIGTWVCIEWLYVAGKYTIQPFKYLVYLVCYFHPTISSNYRWVVITFNFSGVWSFRSWTENIYGVSTKTILAADTLGSVGFDINSLKLPFFHILFTIYLCFNSGSLSAGILAPNFNSQTIMLNYFAIFLHF